MSLVLLIVYLLLSRNIST